MFSKYRTLAFGAALSLLGTAMFGTAAVADSITPDTYSTTLNVGESVTIRKTVEITERPSSARVDVFFLSDTTGSMGGEIGQVKTNALSVLSNISGLGDVQFAVGEYKDITDAFTYRLNTALTSNTTDVQAGINAWSATGGGDYAEANLFGLEEAAENTPWRDGSTRILIWFGDAPGHDPRAGSTEASATAALTAENIRVQAVNSGGLDDYGQATRITNATGGNIFNIAGSGDGIVDAINDAITATFSEYNKVTLAVNGAAPGVDVSFTPANYMGDFDRSITRTFDFDVTFTGLVAGTHNFTIDALVDGGVVATEKDSIRVNGGVPPVPLPATLPLLLGALGAGGLLSRLRKSS